MSQRLFEICTDGGVPENVFEEIKIYFNQEQDKTRSEMNELRAKNRELERLRDNQKQIIKEQGERFKSKIMSAYYLMGAVAKMGTHREKETAIRFIQCTLDDIVKGHNDLSWDQDLFNIPF